MTASHKLQHSSILGDDLTIAWAVESFDRAKLDLEKLRQYLTDACLLAACGRHLNDHGPDKISGVAYHKVAKPSKRVM